MIAQAIPDGRFRVLYASSILLCIALSFAASGQAATPPPLTTLYNFPGGSQGSFPAGGVILGSNNVLFGTTYSGGLGWGTVYQLTPPASSGAPWTASTLYSFTGLGGDGANPQGLLFLGPGNILYGTTVNGGTFGLGTVFQLVPPTTGGNWTESVIYSFAGGADGQNPEAGLVMSTTGNLYGTTAYGGTGTCGAGCGTVFQLKPNGSGGWTENVVYTFLGGTDGEQPMAELYLGKSNILYGTTYAGGMPATGVQGSGTVFQLVAGSPWKETILYTFTGMTDGAGPWGRLTPGPNNAFFGSTFWAGSNKGCRLGGYVAGCGTIFELTPPATSGNPWTFAVVYTFTGAGSDGAHPLGAMNYSNSLYGSTFAGGSSVNTCFPQSYTGCGAIFQLVPPTGGGTTWTKKILHSFTDTDGGGPNGILHSTTGAIYGTTYLGGASPGLGTVFQIQ